jgi:hypothetical protein
MTGGRSWQAYGTASTTAANTKLYAFSLGTLYDITVSGNFLASAPDSNPGTGSGATYYGQGNYGDGPYGSGQPAGTLTEADIWHLDNFGNILLACQVPSNNSIYQWDPTTPGTPCSVVSGAPTSNRGIVVTPERFLVALGAGGDVRKVQWADRESLTDWTVTADNEAGDIILEGNGRIMRGMRGRAETLIWTDAELFAMQYIGGSYVYSFQKRGSNCGLVAPLAVAEFNGAHIWMGLRGFYIYDGYVRRVPCEVQEYVFNDINRDQRIKFNALINHEFSEITWFYCSAASSEIDRYVTWNYESGVWTTGYMERTCSIPATSTNARPVMLDASGNVFLHESGWDHTIEQATNYTPFIESGPVEINKGDRLLHITKVIPDEKNLGDVETSIYVSIMPMRAETEIGPFTSTDDEQDARAHGRWARITMTEVKATDWRVGQFKLDVKQGSRR